MQALSRPLVPGGRRLQQAGSAQRRSTACRVAYWNAPSTEGGNSQEAHARRLSLERSWLDQSHGSPDDTQRRQSGGQASTSSSADGGSSSPRASHITLLLKRSTSWQEVRQVLSQHGASFTDFHVCTALVHTMQLVKEQAVEPADAEQYQEFATDLVALVSGCTDQLGPRQLANTAWALARLHVSAPSCGADQLLQELLPRIASFMPWFEPQHLANVAWAVAKVELSPDDAWLEDFLAYSEQLLPRFEPQHLANTLWALSRMGVTPGDAWMTVFLDRTARALPSFAPRDTSQLWLSLASLGVAPDSLYPGLMPSMAKHLVAQLPQASPQAIANSAWALATLAQQQRQQEQQAEAGQQQQLQQQRGWASTSSTTCVGHLYAELERRLLAASPRLPRPQHQQQAVPAELLELASAASQCMWAGATLGVQPPPSLARTIFVVTQTALADMHPHVVSNLAWAVAKLQGSAPSPGQSQALQPPAKWVASLLQASLAHLHAYSDQSIGNLLWALARMHITPEPAWAAAVVAHVHTHLQSIGPQALANTMWALARMGYSLDPGTANVLVALLRRHLHQIEENLGELESGAAAAAEAGADSGAPDVRFNAQELSNILYALARFRHHPGDDTLSLLVEEVRAQLVHPGTFTAQELANIAWALTELAATQSAPAAAAVAAAGAAAAIASEQERLRAQQSAGARAQQSSEEETDAEVEEGVSGADLGRLVAPGPVEATPADSEAVGTPGVGNDFLDTLWASMEVELASFQARDLAQAVYAMAKLGWRPPASPAPAQAAKPKRGAAASAKAGKKPAGFSPSGGGSGWAHPFLAAAYAAMPSATTLDLSNMAWGLAQLGARPDQAWLGRLALGLCRQASLAQPHHLAITLWALGRMGYRPAPGWLASVEEALFRHMKALRPRELAATAQSFAAMGYAPAVELLEVFAEHCMACAAEFSQQDWAVVIHSLANVVEGQGHLEDLFISPGVRTQIDNFGPSALAMMTYACGMLGARSSSLLGRLLRACQRHGMAAFSAQELSAVMCACAKLEHVPSDAYVEEWLAELSNRLPTLAGSVLACCAWALATLAVPLPPTWHAAFCVCLGPRLGELSAQEAAMVAWALCEFRLPLDPKLASDIEATLRRHRRQYTRYFKVSNKNSLQRLQALARREVEVVAV